MPLKLVSTVADHTDALARVYLDAFADSPASQVMVTIRDATVQAIVAANQRKQFESPPDDAERTFMLTVIDVGAPVTDPRVPDGEIIGSCVWKHELASAQEEHQMDMEAVPGANVEARKVFFGMLDSARARHMAGKDFMHLKLLATAPKHSGRGAARLCLEYGCKMADELGLSTYLDSTPAGRAVYQRFGFEVLEEEAWDLRPYGKDVTYYTCTMLRPAKR